MGAIQYEELEEMLFYTKFWSTKQGSHTKERVPFEIQLPEVDPQAGANIATTVLGDIIPRRSILHWQKILYNGKYEARESTIILEKTTPMPRIFGIGEGFGELLKIGEWLGVPIGDIMQHYATAIAENERTMFQRGIFLSSHIRDYGVTEDNNVVIKTFAGMRTEIDHPIAELDPSYLCHEPIRREHRENQLGYAIHHKAYELSTISTALATAYKEAVGLPFEDVSFWVTKKEFMNHWREISDSISTLQNRQHQYTPTAIWRGTKHIPLLSGIVTATILRHKYADEFTAMGSAYLDENFRKTDEAIPVREAVYR